MAFVKILAPLTGGNRDEAVLTSAISAALPFGGHVAGLFVRSDPALTMPFYGEGVSTVVVQEVMDTAKKESDRAAVAAQAILSRLARATDVAVTEACEKRDAPSVSLRETTGLFADCVAREARLSDLVVFAAAKDDERSGITEAVEAVLLEARRPVLLSCRAMAPGFHERIAIGWNASVESAQAVSAALPFLTRAARVDVLAVAEPDAPCAQCDALVEYLKLHGVSAGAREIAAGERSVAQALLEEVDGAGLLVLGGYGHSRWRELFQGGITRHAIAHSDLPLFLVH
ncbi:MAG: universal stress protein [Alphaproteobacteria bacterium]|nr:universal stress protein [Alphaproteobacteria bacterium]